MISASRPNKPKVTSFRTKLLAAMMLVVSGLMALALYLAQRHVAAAAQSNLQQNFQAELLSLDKVRELRNAALAEHCGALASRPRIHAALEDNALDLLYPSAKDELRDLMEPAEPSQTEPLLRAKFYRFLDPTGGVLLAAKSQRCRTIKPKSGSATDLEEITRDATNRLYPGNC